MWWRRPGQNEEKPEGQGQPERFVGAKRKELGFLNVKNEDLRRDSAAGVVFSTL